MRSVLLGFILILSLVSMAFMMRPFNKMVRVVAHSPIVVTDGTKEQLIGVIDNSGSMYFDKQKVHFIDGEALKEMYVAVLSEHNRVQKTTFTNMQIKKREQLKKCPCFSCVQNGDGDWIPERDCKCIKCEAGRKK